MIKLDEFVALASNGDEDAATELFYKYQSEVSRIKLDGCERNREIERSLRKKEIVIYALSEVIAKEHNHE